MESANHRPIYDRVLATKRNDARIYSVERESLSNATKIVLWISQSPVFFSFRA